MPNSLDFNWHEGDQGFEVSNPDTQWLPPEPQPEIPHMPERALPAPAKEWSNWALLAIGVVLGLSLGVIVLVVQGQRTVRSDVAPLIDLQQRALAANDIDLYASLIEPDDVEWRAQIPAIIAGLKLLMPESAVAPKVRSVKYQDDFAEIAVDFAYDGQRYRTLISALRTDGKWRLARARLDGWGEFQTVTGQNAVLHMRERDAFLESYLPEIDAVTQSFCQRYAVPPPCQIDLQIDSNPRLQPFLPGIGAVPPPALGRWRIFGEGDTPLLILNSDGQEGRDPDFQSKLVAYLPQTHSINDFYAARVSSQDAIDLSFQRLHERTIPVALPSPRFVGVRGREVHPLWRLALYEAIGDAILRRGMGPVSAEEDALFGLWAAARGDAAIWAERFAQVALPAEKATADTTDARVIGESLVNGDVRLRNPARDFALFLHRCLSEQTTLDWLLNARNEVGSEAVMAPLGLSVEDLNEAWQQYEAGGQCPAGPTPVSPATD